MSRALIAVLLVALPAACGDDQADADAAAIDGATTDAVIDSGGPDADPDCPTSFKFEAEVFDLIAGVSVPFVTMDSVTVVEVGNETNTAQSAPNGRVILCVTPGQDSVFRFTHPMYLDTLHTMDPEAQSVLEGTPGAGLRVHMLKPADADTFVGNLAGSRTAGTAQVFIDMRSYPANAPATGGGAGIAASNSGVYHEDSGGNFSSGATVTDGDTIFFANALPGNGTTGVSITAPSGQSCDAPINLMIEADAFSSALVACH